METVARSHIQDVLDSLPPRKLQTAYELLLDLAKEDGGDEVSLQVRFMRLPAHERYRLLARQAEGLTAHYEETAEERREWQAGEFVDEC